MVTVLGHQGYLGKVVERRWRELGATGDYVVVCLTPDNLPLLRRLAARPGVIVPSTDAIAEDTEYAATKREVEDIAGLVVIRAGIIDIRKKNDDDNSFCNPLTPLEWADLAWELRDQPGVHVAGRNLTSRATVGAAIRRAFRLERKDPIRGPYINRTQPSDREWPNVWDAVQTFADWLDE